MRRPKIFGNRSYHFETGNQASGFEGLFETGNIVGRLRLEQEENE